MRRIGGSDIGKLLGLSPYGGPAEVYDRIVDGVEAEWNDRMARGAACEPELRAYGQRILRLELDDYASDIAVHPGVEFAHAQIDDRAHLRGVPVAVDYKTQSTFAKGWGPDGSDEVPEHYRAQMAWELACCDRDLGLFVVGYGTDLPPPRLFDISNVCTYHIQRDGVFESYCLDVARDFWIKHVIPRVPPAATPKKEKRNASRTSDSP
jgi:putative phage-type endonuclease